MPYTVRARQSFFRLPLGAAMKTHDVANQVPELQDFNPYDTDIALSQGVQRGQAGWHASTLANYGAELGSAEVLQMAALANRHAPELNTHDRFGNRIDRVD